MIVCNGRQHDFDSEGEGLYLSFSCKHMFPTVFQSLWAPCRWKVICCCLQLPSWSWLLGVPHLMRKKRKKRWQTKLRQRCQLRMITSVKFRLFMLESPWQLSITWNRENNNLLLFLEPQQITILKRKESSLWSRHLRKYICILRREVSEECQTCISSVLNSADPE